MHEDEYEGEEVEFTEDSFSFLDRFFFNLLKNPLRPLSELLFSLSVFHPPKEVSAIPVERLNPFIV